MKAVAVVLLLMLPHPAVTYAAQVHGSLREGNKSVKRGVAIEIVCGRHSRSSGATDDHGSYQIYVRETGRCIFNVHYQGQRVEAVIYSHDDPVRYDFGLVKQQDGRYELRRK